MFHSVAFACFLLANFQHKDVRLVMFERAVCAIVLKRIKRAELGQIEQQIWRQQVCKFLFNLPWVGENAVLACILILWNNKLIIHWALLIKTVIMRHSICNLVYISGLLKWFKYFTTEAESEKNCWVQFLSVNILHYQTRPLGEYAVPCLLDVALE